METVFLSYLIVLKQRRYSSSLKLTSRYAADKQIFPSAQSDACRVCEKEPDLWLWKFRHRNITGAPPQLPGTQFRLSQALNHEKGHQVKNIKYLIAL